MTEDGVLELPKTIVATPGKKRRTLRAGKKFQNLKRKEKPEKKAVSQFPVDRTPTTLPEAVDAVETKRIVPDLRRVIYSKSRKCCFRKRFVLFFSCGDNFRFCKCSCSDANYFHLFGPVSYMNHTLAQARLWNPNSRFILVTDQKAVEIANIEVVQAERV